MKERREEAEKEGGEEEGCKESEGMNEGRKERRTDKRFLLHSTLLSGPKGLIFGLDQLLTHLP